MPIPKNKRNQKLLADGSNTRTTSSASNVTGGSSEKLLTELRIQHSLLDQLKTCYEILEADPINQVILDWKSQLEFLLSARSRAEFDGVISEFLLNGVLRSAIDFDLPSDLDQQLLTGMVFSEASGSGGDEIKAIVACLKNVAYYATYESPPKTCYNESFGDGTILSAIKRTSMGYNSAQWKRIMNGDVLRSKTDLENSLIPVEVAKLRACCDGVASVCKSQIPHKDANSGRILVQFNKAKDKPPSPRQEKVANYGAHTFYAFRIDRECQ